MLRTVLMTLILLFSADILLFDGKYTGATKQIGVAMWRSTSR
ncbi:MAG: hypothetical protein WD207_09070 [Xanthobacteraceae bacterium]